MQPASISSVKSLPRMRLLNSLSVLADLDCHPKTVSHNLGPKYRSECLSYVTELYLRMEKSDCLKFYLDLCSLKILQIVLGHGLYLTLYIRIQMSCKHSNNYTMYSGFDFRSFVLSSLRLLLMVPTVTLLLLLIIIKNHFISV